MKHPIRRRLMYLGFQGLRRSVQWLPLGVSRAFGRALGWLAYVLLRSQRRLTKRHLIFALGDSLSAPQRRRVAGRVFQHLGQNIMEWLRLPQLSLRDLQALVVSEGLEHLRAAIAKGNGAIVVTAHFGNWEMIPLYLKSLGFEGGVLARRLRYPEYESFLITMRGAKGVPTFVRGSVKEVAKVLRANQIIGLLPDQDIDSLEGVFVNFFGHPAHTPVGPAALSLMTGAPILPCFMIREGARFRLVIEPPVAIPQTGDRAQAIATLTQAWSDVIESYVRRYPEQWVWMHRRWKTQPSASPQSTVHSPQQEPSLRGPLQPSLSLCLLLSAYCLVLSLTGCSKPLSEKPAPTEQASTATTEDPNADQQLSAFTLTSHSVEGTKRWELSGQGASMNGNIVSVLKPDGVGYDQTRTSYLKASAAQVNQTNHHVRLEHDVTIHTSDGLWLTTPVMYWIPDLDQMATDNPVRIETDHMLIRGRGATGFAGLKQAVLLED
ncbi:MAG: LPS export ABC transporter periplasmic protein LptC, partial [Candidatus Omnitrophota bacterium]|nr:LPS export ABC transporter periplasmic protein LptC [Candidatus Omnitrophota bacterium]